LKEKILLEVLIITKKLRKNINFKLFKATDLSLFFSGVGFVGSIFGLTSGLVVPQCSLNTTSL